MTSSDECFNIWSLISKARDKLSRNLVELDGLPESISGAGQGSWS